MTTKLPIESEMALATLSGFVAAHLSTAPTEVEKALARIREIIARQIEALELPIESEMALATLSGFVAAHLSTAPTEVEKALARIREIIARQIEALEEAYEYFDNLSDADFDGEDFVANTEMRLAMAMSNAITPEVF